MDLREWAMFAFLALVAADRGASVMGNWWKRWHSARGLVSEQAHAIVEAEERDRALRQLAAKADVIIAAVTPNGGGSVADHARQAVEAVSRLDVRLTEHIDESKRTHAALFAGQREVKSGREA